MTIIEWTLFLVFIGPFIGFALANLWKDRPECRPEEEESKKEL